MNKIKKIITMFSGGILLSVSVASLTIPILRKYNVFDVYGALTNTSESQDNIAIKSEAKRVASLSFITTKTSVYPSTITGVSTSDLGITLPSATHGTKFTFAIKSHDDDYGTLTITITITKGRGKTIREDLIIKGFKNDKEKNTQAIQDELKIVGDKLHTIKSRVLPSKINDPSNNALGLKLPIAKNGTKFDFIIKGHDDSAGTITLKLTISKGSGISATKDIIVDGYLKA